MDIDINIPEVDEINEEMTPPAIDGAAPKEEDADVAAKKNRQEKKQERYDRLLAEERNTRRMAEERAHAAEMRSAAFEERMREVERKSQSRFEESEKENIDKQIDDAYQKRVALLQSYNAIAQNGKLSDADTARYMRDITDLDDALFKLRTQKHMRPTPSTPVQVDNEATRRNAGIEFIKQRHFDVVSNQRALQYANGRFQTRVATLGKQPDAKELMEIIDASMDDARSTFNLAARVGESPTARQKLSGIGNEYGGSAQRKGTAPLTKDQRVMARAAYGYLGEDEKAFKAFRENVLK